MQTTQVSAYSLRQVLKQNAQGIKVAGYTVRPGYSNGLFMYAKQQRGAYVGFCK
jgi:hypothetical protein